MRPWCLLSLAYSSNRRDPRRVDVSCVGADRPVLSGPTPFSRYIPVYLGLRGGNGD